MVALSLTVPRGEAGFWSIIRDLDQTAPWTVRMVYDRSNVALQVVAHFVRKLHLGGYAELVGQKPQLNLASANLYRLVKKPLLVPRLRADGTELPETAAERLWRAMKMAKQFAPADLAELCPGVAKATAHNYCHQLAAAGVLVRSGGSFRLLRNLGNQAPKILATKMVFDPNAGVIVGPSVAREVQP
jgi:hypothetical protein